MENRQFLLDRHQRFTTQLSQIKGLIDEILLPEDAPREQDLTIVAEAPWDVKVILAFMITLDDILQTQQDEPDMYERFCVCLTSMFERYPMQVIDTLNQLGIRLENAERAAKKKKKDVEVN